MTTLTAATPSLGGSVLAGQAPRPAPAAAAAAMSGADVLRILRQRLVLILFVWILLIGATVGFTLFMRTNHPKYNAYSLIRVDSIQPKDPTKPLFAKEQTTAEQVARELANQALIVESAEVLQKVLKDPDIRRTTWFKEAEIEAEEEGELMEDLLADLLAVGPVRDTNFLRVSADWKVPTEIPEIVNTVVSEYRQEINQQSKRAIQSANVHLSEEVDRAKRELETVKQSIENFRQTSDFSTVTSNEANEKLLTLTALVTELEVEMLGRKTQWEALQNARIEDLPITAELQAMLNADPVIYALEQQLMNAETNLGLAEERFGPNHRVVKDARANRDAAALSVQRERGVKTTRFQSRQVEQAHRNFLEAQEQLLELREKLYEAKAEQRDKDIKRARYEGLLEERDHLTQQYQELLRQRNIVQRQVRSERYVQVEIRSRAVTPLRMSSPKLTIWIPAGSLIGLVVAIGLAMLLELTDKSVRTPRDVMRAQLPVLGTIPTTDDDEVDIERVETASLDAPHSVVAEAFRNLRANLFFSAPAEQQGVILVTSPSASNGKTTVSANLAISIALSGRRVLLVDANFRRSRLPGVFDNMKTEGLSNILIGQGYLKDYVTETSVPGLDVLGAGPVPPNPAELLGSSYLRDVVVDARSRYDQVIFDGPPVLLVSDAMVLAGAVDGCLLVCEYRATSRGALMRTQANLEAINARIFGAVLNLVQSRAGGYFRKQYREFYDYVDDEQAGVPRPRLDISELTGHGDDLDDDVGPMGGSPQPPGDDGPGPDLPLDPVDDGGDIAIEDMPVDLDSEIAAPMETPSTESAAPPSYLPEASAEPEESVLDAIPDLGSDLEFDDDLADLDGEEFKIDTEFDLGDDLDGFGSGEEPERRP